MFRNSPSLKPLKRYKVQVIIGPLLKLFEVASELFTPFLTKYMIDRGIANKDWEYTLVLGAVMLGMAVLGFGVTMIAQWLASRVSADYGYDLRKKMFAHLSELSDKQVDGFGKEKALTLINSDAFILQNGVMMYMRLLARSPMLIRGSTILSFVVDYRAGLVFLVVILLSSAVLAAVVALSPKRYAALQSDLDGISALGSDSLKGARPIRAFNKEGFEKAKFAQASEKYRQDGVTIGKINAFINPLTFFFINLGIAIVVYLGGRLIGGGSSTFTSGSVIALISYLTSSLAALVMFSRLIVSLNKAFASKRRVDAFLDLEPAIENRALWSEKDAVADAPLVVFQDVSLTYGQKGDKPAVRGLSFAIASGSTIGLIGGTGSGKSSTIALLERLYEPSHGRIFYRGLPLEEYDLDSLRREISFVSQKPALFLGTVRSNLLLGKPDATERELVAALKDSLAYEFVSRYGDFLDHPIEQGGANLSGGQRQRLLIARGLLHGGDVLILDDSMSALDYLSDKKVRANLAKRKNLTKIIVSQRATSLTGCDRIMVYEEGRIVGMGTHQELLASCPIYKEIYEMQVRAQ